jgi:glucose repression mediator protein
LQDYDKAILYYENALRHNPYNIRTLNQVATVCKNREQYPKAVEYLQRILNIESTHGEAWSALGHCYLMMDDLQKAYNSYQQAIYHLPNPKVRIKTFKATHIRTGTEPVVRNWSSL